MKRQNLTLGDLCLDLYERLALDLCDSDAAAIISAAEINRRLGELPTPPETSTLTLGPSRELGDSCRRRRRAA